MKYLAMILFLMIWPLSVQAEVCNDDVYLGKVNAANAVKINYQYEDGLMKVVAANHDGIYFKVGNNEKSVVGSNIGSFPEGSSVEINYHSEVDLGCGRGNLITKYYLKLPYYNPFSEDERCLDRVGMAACEKYYPVKMTSELFEQAIFSYDQEIYNLSKRNVDKIDNKVVESWFFKYRYYIGIVTIFVGLAIWLVIALIKKYRLRREL